MEKWTEDEIEQFIRDNKDRFDIVNLKVNHENKFLVKLSNKFKKIVSIVPYLIRLTMITILVFAISICVWNFYIRKDRHEITFKQKIENIIKLKK